MNLESLNMEDLNEWWAKFSFRNSRKDRFRVYRKMQGMLSMNEALSRCLDRLHQNASEMGKHPERPAAQALRSWFLSDRLGKGLAESMEGWVPSAELYMIRAGEESGTTAKALGSIQAMGERSKEMRAAVMHAVAYPVAMLILVSFVLYTFGVNMIQNMKQTAPPKVMAAIGSVADVSDFIADWGVWIIVFFIALFFLISTTLPFWRGHLRSKMDMYPPWSWYRVLQGSSFLLGMSALLGAQVPLKRSLEILEEQANPWLRERIGSARAEVLRGRNLGEALRTGRFNFPDPGVAIDLEILSERADVGSVIEQVTNEWIRDQIDDLKAQSVVARNVGLTIVGGVIGWVMTSVMAVVTQVANGGGGAGGM